MCCSVLQCVALCDNVLQWLALSTFEVCHGKQLPHVAVRCGALQCVAVRCSAMQCVRFEPRAPYCGVLQFGAVC